MFIYLFGFNLYSVNHAKVGMGYLNSNVKFRYLPNKYQLIRQPTKIFSMYLIFNIYCKI